MAAFPSSALPTPSPSVLYRIFHATDLHFYVQPTWREVITEPKRLIGLFNAQVLGRKNRFSRQVQQQLIGEVHRHRPSHVVLTGDLTSFATEAEFRVAHSALLPILGRRLPRQLRADRGEEEGGEEEEEVGRASPAAPQTVLLRGNHDVYTSSAAHTRLFDRFFGGWRPSTGALLPLDGSRLQMLVMDPCQPNRVSSHGHFDPQQLSAVSSALSSAASNPSPSFLLLLTHYPLLDRDGSDYSARHPFHGVDNGRAMLDVLRKGLAAFMQPSGGGRGHSAALLHGHVHKGYRVELPLPSSSPQPLSLPILNPGSGGRSFSAQHHRAATYAVYTVSHSGEDATANSESGAQQWQLHVERFVHNGTAFEKEEEAFTSAY